MAPPERQHRFRRGPMKLPIISGLTPTGHYNADYERRQARSAIGGGEFGMNPITVDTHKLGLSESATWAFHCAAVLKSGFQGRRL